MRSFISWWFAQLAGLLPDIVTRAALRPADAIILEVDSGTVTLLLRAQGTVTSAARARADEAGMREIAQAITTYKPRTSRLVLRLSAAQVLCKHLSLPPAVRRDLRNLLGFEIERETPFTQEEVYWTYQLRRQEAARGLLDVELLLVPRIFADRFIETARAAGLNPIGIETDMGGDKAVFIPLAGERRARWLRPESSLLPFAAAAGAIALIVIGAPFLYQEWAIASADKVLAALGTEAREAIAIRQSADQRARAADFIKMDRVRNGNVLKTLAAITRSLPDDSHLTGFNLRAGQLTMTGLSPAAAGLVGTFANLPGFREPALDSPVVGSKSGDLETFTISVKLVPAETP